jgi:hypothetical protein
MTRDLNYYFSNSLLIISHTILFLKKVSIFLVLCFSFSSWGADIKVISDYSAMIRGEIAASDVQKVRDLPKKISMFSLISIGGDVAAAIQIGRVIRAREGTTFVSQNNSCYSSCALIYIAGVSRYNHGVVGLHRPYLAGEPSSSTKIKESVPKMLSDIRKYVKEMGITNRFTEIMINTPPESMQRFYFDEIKAIVPPEDPIYDEIQVAYSARQYGITTEEYRKRDAAVYEACAHNFDDTLQNNKRYTLCHQAFYWGLSVFVFEKRIKGTDVKCKISEDEMSILKKADEDDGEWRSHPIAINRDKCIVNIMRGAAGD